LTNFDKGRTVSDDSDVKQIGNRFPKYCLLLQPVWWLWGPTSFSTCNWAYWQGFGLYYFSLFSL